MQGHRGAEKVREDLTLSHRIGYTQKNAKFGESGMLGHGEPEELLFGTVYPLGKCGREKKIGLSFPGGAVVKNPPANAGDMGSSPGLGGSHMPRSN